MSKYTKYNLILTQNWCCYIHLNATYIYILYIHVYVFLENSMLGKRKKKKPIFFITYAKYNRRNYVFTDDRAQQDSHYEEPWLYQEDMYIHIQRP